MRIFVWLLLIIFGESCSHTLNLTVGLGDKTEVTQSVVKAYPAYPALAPIEAMSSTVRIDVTIQATSISIGPDGGTIETPTVDGWMGSGVVYDKTDRLAGPVRSRILSANHVLETPIVGSVTEETAEFFGIQFVLGKKRIDAVDITLQTADGRTCKLKVLALGSNDTHDVATAEADCDAGRVAQLATSVPVMGEKIFISGYPLGILLPLLTEGYVSGWDEGYLLISGSAWGGNSGGPVFHDGKVIGLLVRGSRSYSHISLAAGLEECLRRIAETPPLK